MDKTIHEKIEDLTRRIQQLAQQQTTISSQLVQLMNELDALKRNAGSAASTATITPQPVETAIKTVEVNEVIEAPARHSTPVTPILRRTAAAAPSSRTSSSFEEFIGKNVASKVGILVTIIGIFIGAKYAIDHELVSPLVRVINGYICGAALIGIAIWLKKKYEAYSSVLMGGGLAVLYFITYIAYSFYHMMPLEAAFGLMMVFTAGTVYAALLYDRVIIAHLALIGAYAIPFLLSNNSGRYAVFFGYIAIINTGILIVSLRKYWKSLFYAAFALTWVIYISWFLFRNEQHTFIAWTYLSVFFLVFYATFLAYKIIKKEQYGLHDVFVLLSNSFIFYWLGFALTDHESTYNYAGLFTIINAAIHLAVSQTIRRLQLADRSLYYLLLGLVIVFCTIAVPVQLDGNWVTLLWTAEAVLVFWIGRTRQAPSYEKLGVGLAVLSFLSLVHDWFNHAAQFTFPTGQAVDPFINIVFASGLLVAAAQTTIIYFNRNKKYQSGLAPTSPFLIFYNYVFPGILLITVYFVFQVEINGYFRQLNKELHPTRSFYNFYESGIGAFGFVVLLLYSMVFITGCVLVNLRWVRNKILAAFSITAIVLLVIVLLTRALSVLNELTVAYFAKGGNYFGALEFTIRYAVVAVTAIMLYAGQQTIKAFITDAWVQKGWPLVMHTVILAFLSAEYLCWTTVRGSDNQYKLGLSILWGLYAMMLVVLGIRKKQKYLRLAAIILFSITLLKLFVYDLAGAGTITKTVSFISLGVLLLVVSFLYNKYKEVLFGEPDRGEQSNM